jgi:DNA polymerase III epsilon subunit family exonuclease
MPPTFVALDLETTGLEPDRDAIIEIGAVKFKGERVEAEFSTLVNPNRRLTPFITKLTGITDAMLVNAPRLPLVLPKLEAFVGDAVIIGHNIGFDLSFLRAKGAVRHNPSADTYALASVLLPSAGRYNLGSLSKALGISLPGNNAHRALDDCRTTVGVYLALLEKARTLPLPVLADIVQIGRDLEWGGGLIFEEALRARSQERVGPRQAGGLPDSLLGPLFARHDARENPPLQRKAELEPLDLDELAALLEHAGPFSKHFPNYEFRAEQVQMLRAVARAFSEGRHLIVEAGTGTGKCLTGDAVVTFEDGHRSRLDDLYNARQPISSRVLSMSPQGRLIYQNVQGIHANGRREVWRLVTALGRKITATANHPFLTFQGWQHLSELEVGMRLATIRSLPAGEQPLPDYEAFAVGAMLGDGGCVIPGSPTFTNFDPQVVKAVGQAIGQLGNVDMVATQAPGHYIFKRRTIMGHQRSGLSLLLEKHEITGKSAHYKRIPINFFKADARTLSRVLAGLWVTDGSIEARDGHPTVASASEQMMVDVQHLLLRLGIISRVRYKSAKLGAKRFDSWCLTVSDMESKRAFYRTVGQDMVGARRQRLDEWWQQHGDQRFNPNDDLIPNAAWGLINDERQRAGKSWYSLRNACVVASDRTREISRAKLAVMGAFLGSPKLSELAQSDIYWDKIISIELVGEQPTYDLTMTGEPNFVANDVVVHNSVGYLIPAAVWALQNNERVVISTNTLNLQDQLIRKDIPDLQAALGLDFRAALLKGRSHYLCPRRLDSLRRHGPKTADEMRVLAKVLVWLSESEGNTDSAGLPLNELSLGPHERAIWLRISAEDEGCTGDMCQGKMQGRCPFFRARRAAQAAHVVIVNHALLLADIASENRVIPDYRYLVIDEAHHLEAATTDGLSFEVNRPDLERRLRDLGGPSAGTLGMISAGTHGALPPDLYGRFERDVSRAFDGATSGLALSRHFFDAVAQFMEEQREAQALGEYTQQVRVIPATRTQPYWEQVQMHWEELRRVLSPLGELLTRLAGALGELEEYDIEDREDLMSAATAAGRYLNELVTNLNGLVFKPDPSLIYWAEVRRESDRVSLHAAPLHVGPLVQKHLWNAKESVVLTSATLTTAGEFDYVRGRLSAAEADEVSVGSPFDYETSTLLYLPNDIPEPHQRVEYQRAVEKALIETVTATRGRTLVLFTSYAQLKQTAQAIRGPLANANIDVYDQSDGTPRSTLLDNFKTAASGVLLGTKSFWEGVDVPGEALSLLVIVKLPFDVPTDPIIAARSETFERAFNDYNLPEAVLKFRQGFGRLIRSRSDRGVVVILDRRLLTKQYGRMFLDSLPACTVRMAPLAQLPRDAARWIDGG